MSFSIQCKCNAYLGCRKGWDVRIEFSSPEAAREAGWMVHGNWPRWITRCPEHAEEFRANVRRIARSQPLGDDDIFEVSI